MDRTIPEPAAPVSESERIVALDLMRGIAVLGILVANVVAFGHADLAYYWPPALPGGATRADEWIWLAQFVAVDGKMRGLFTMLFGAGLLLFIDRATLREGTEERALLLQVRRLVLLALVGLAHFYLLFRGDILFGYAVAGAGALLLVRLPGERLLALGLIWAVIAGAMQVLSYLTPALLETGSTAAQADVVTYYSAWWEELVAEAAQQARVLGQGSYAQVLAYRVAEESGLLWNYARYTLFETIPLMLLGMGLYRLGAFTAGEGSRAIAWGGVLLGLALNLAAGLWVMAHGFAPYVTQLAFFGLSNLANLPLLLGGTVLLARWAAGPHEGWLAQRLVLAGRMALTNYVGTSLLMMVLFHGWAGGLFGQLHRAELLLVVLLGWAAMLGFSRLWLGRFRQGPLEWAWRCGTYGRRFPNRLPLVERD